MTIETKEKIILFWSGGKDCALALHEIKKADQFEIACIFTTLNVETNHVHFHFTIDTFRFCATHKTHPS